MKKTPAPLASPAEKAPKVKPGTALKGAADHAKKKVSLSKVKTEENGNVETQGVSFDAKGVTLSQSSAFGEEGVGDHLRIGKGGVTVGTKTTGPLKTGTNASATLGPEGVAAQWGSVDAQGTKEKRSLKLNTEQAGFASTSSDKIGRVQEETSLQVGQGGYKGALVRGGYGLGLQNNEEGVGAMASVAGQRLGVTGNEEGMSVGGAFKVGKVGIAAEAGFDNKGFSVKGSGELGNRSLGLELGVQDGQTTVGGKASLGILGAGGSVSALNRQHDGMTDDPLLGTSFESSSAQGSGGSQNFALVASEEGAWASSRSTRVRESLDAEGWVDPEAMRRQRDKLQRGESFDPKRLDQGQSVSVTEEDYEMGGGGADVLLYDIQSRIGETQRSTQSVTYTEQGMRLRDVQEKQRAQEGDYGIGLGLLRSGSSRDTETDTEVVEYLVDPESEFGMESTRFFVDLGLLPGWEMLAPFKLSHPLREAITELYGRPYLSSVRLQDFKAKHQAEIQKVNAFVRQDLKGSAPTNYPGVSFVGRSETHADVESDQATNLLFFPGAPEIASSNRAEQTRFSEDGQAYTERSWSSKEGGKEASVRSSGSLAAESALRVQSVDEKRATDLDLSPTVLAALGERMSQGKRGRALWRGLAERSGAYWSDRDPRISNIDLPGGIGGIGAQMASITSVGHFLELDPVRQQAFIQGALWEGRDGGAPYTLGSGFDAMAGICAMPEGVERDEAVMQLAKWASEGDRDAARALNQSVAALGGTAVFLAKQAGKGESMNGGLLSNPEDPAPWASEFAALFAGGKANNDEVYVLLQLARAHSPFRISEMLEGAEVSSLAVAERLAQSSASKPETFVSWMAEGPDGAALQAWWNKVSGRVFTDKLARDEQEAPNRLARTPKLDGQGLGGMGMDMELMDAQMAGILAKQEQAKKDADFSKFLEDWQERRASLPPLLTPMRERELAHTLHAALRTRDAAAVAEVLEGIQETHGAFGLDQIVQAHCVDADFADYTESGSAGRVLAALAQTRMGERLLAAE